MRAPSSLAPLRFHICSAIVGFYRGCLLSSTCTCSTQVRPSRNTHAAAGPRPNNYRTTTIVTKQNCTVNYLRFDLSYRRVSASGQSTAPRHFVSKAWVVCATDYYDVYPINSTWNKPILMYSSALLFGVSIREEQPIFVTAAMKNNSVFIDISPSLRNWGSGSVTDNGAAIVSLVERRKALPLIAEVVTRPRPPAVHLIQRCTAERDRL